MAGYVVNFKEHGAFTPDGKTELPTGQIICSNCGKQIVIAADSIAVGYCEINGETGPEKWCYACMADIDRAYMDQAGRIDLYLHGHEKVTNWPGTLSFKVLTYRAGRHNIARTRTDVWFKHNGYYWHGVQYGEWTQIVHCKRTASK